MSRAVRLVWRAYADLWGEAVGRELTMRRRLHARVTVLVAHVSVMVLVVLLYAAASGLFVLVRHPTEWPR